MQKQPSLSPFRSKLFPVYNNELLGFFLLSSCFLCVALEYAALRGCKDTLILCLKKGGPEAIAASKIFVIFFMILIKIMYDFMSKHVSTYNRFNYVFGYFIAFFSFTVFVLYPNRDHWQIISLTEKLNNMPILNRFWPVWLMVRHWPITLIYMHAECVGSFGLGVSLWGITNYISTMSQTKRIYPLFSFFAGLGTLMAGLMLQDVQRFDIINIFEICILGFVLLLAIYNLFIRVVKNRPDVYIVSKQPKKKKVKMSFKESLATVFQSKYYMGIAALVLCQAIGIVLFEAVYRDALKSFAGTDESIIRSWTSAQLIYIGIFQMVCVFLAPYFMRKKWEFTASLLPKIMLTGSCVFFGLLTFRKHLPLVGQIDDAKLFGLIIFSGLLIIVLMKVLKYILFDPCKEMLYFVLSSRDKSICKSSVDGVGGRVGKGFSAGAITFFITPIFGDIASAQWLICILIFATIIAWLWAVKDVGRRFNTLLKANAKDKLDTKPVADAKA